MSSNQTLHMIGKMMIISFRLKCLPFYMNIKDNLQSEPHKLIFVNSREKRLWLISSLLHIPIRNVLLLIGLWYDISTHDLHMSARAQYYVMVSIELMSLFFQFVTLMFAKRIYALQAAFYEFGAKIRHFHQFNPNDSDGGELYIKAFQGVVLGVSSLVPFMFFGLIHFEVHSFSLLKTPYLIVTVMEALALGFIIFTDWLYVFNPIAFLLVYANGCSRSLKSMRWHSQMSKQTQHDLISIYRSHQVLNNWAMQELKYFTLLAASISCIIMISTLFALIGFYNHINHVFAVGAGATFIIALVITKFTMELQGDLPKYSQEFYDSFLSHALSLRMVYRKSMIASYPLQIPLGDITNVSNKTFIFLMSYVVVGRVVDLLLMTPS